MNYLCVYNAMNHMVNFQVVSFEDLCAAYKFMARYNLKRKKLEDAELYAHKCCEYNEVNLLRLDVIKSSAIATAIILIGKVFEFAVRWKSSFLFVL